MNLDECDRIFTQIYDALTPSEVCYALTPLFDYYDVLHMEFGRSDVFWRALPAEELPWLKVARMGYPPPEKAKRNRLNDDGMPALYAATRPETALMEIGATKQDLVQIAGFMANLETPLNIGVVGEHHHVFKTGYLRVAGVDPNQTIIRLLHSKGLEGAQRLLYIDAFLAHLLADPKAKKTNYIRSRAVAAMIYSRNKDIDGIMFPSVRDRLGGMNLALLPQAFDAKMQPVSCVYTKITRIRRFGFFEDKAIKEAENVSADGSTFVWTDPLPPPPRMRYFNMTDEEIEANGAFSQ